MTIAGVGRIFTTGNWNEEQHIQTTKYKRRKKRGTSKEVV